MASERETALAQILSLADRHGIAADEITKHMAAGKVPSRQRGIVKTLLGYMGGTFVFAGIGLLVSMIWDDIGGGQRVVITLGTGIVAFAIAMLCQKDPRYEKAVTPLFLVAALMQPTGLFVFLDEFVPKTGDPALAALIVFSVVALQQGLAFLQFGRASLLFLTLTFWLAFLGTTLDWLSVEEEYIALLVGLSLLFLTYWANLRGYHSITPFWYFVSGGMFLGGIFAVVEGEMLEIVYLGFNGFFVFLSIRLASRSLLFVSVVGLIGYLSYFTYEHFANVIGWPIALIFMGLIMIGGSAFALRLGRSIRSDDG